MFVEITMAKVGEGDARWIVDDLGEAGRNVSAWHWEDRDCSGWAKEWLKNNFKDLTLSADGTLQVSEVKEANGDATYCQRKGKNMFFYELKIKLEFECVVGDTTVKGTINIPEFSEDTPVDDTEIRVTTTSSGADANTAKALARGEGVSNVRNKLREFLAAMTDRFQVTRPDSLPSVKRKPVITATPGAVKAPVTSGTSNTSKSSGKLATETFSCKLEFSGPPVEVFHCFTDKARMSVFTQSEATIEAVPGTEFKLFHGSIVGTVEKAIPGERLVQKWRFQSWPEGHFSKVDMKFSAAGSGTLLTLKHSAIPSDDFDRTRAGWRTNFWERIRLVFGFNFKEA